MYCMDDIHCGKFAGQYWHFVIHLILFRYLRRLQIISFLSLPCGRSTFREGSLTTILNGVLSFGSSQKACSSLQWRLTIFPPDSTRLSSAFPSSLSCLTFSCVSYGFPSALQIRTASGPPMRFLPWVVCDLQELMSLNNGYYRQWHRRPRWLELDLVVVGYFWMSAKSYSHHFQAFLPPGLWRALMLLVTLLRKLKMHGRVDSPMLMPSYRVFQESSRVKVSCRVPLQLVFWASWPLSFSYSVHLAWMCFSRSKPHNPSYSFTLWPWGKKLAFLWQ